MMAIMMKLEPKIHPIVHNIRQRDYFSHETKSDFVKAWVKKTQELYSQEDLQRFDDYNKQLSLLLAQMEEHQQGELIVRLAQTSSWELMDKLREFVYVRHLYDLYYLSEFAEYYIQIYLPPMNTREKIRAINELRSDSSPTVRRILLLRRRFEARMLVRLDELQQQMHLEVGLELERLKAVAWYDC